MSTVFYVAGGALVLAAFLISFFGLRTEGFPSSGVLSAGVGLFALVVAVTAYTAVGSAQDEQQSRRDEANREAAAEADAQAIENEATGEGKLAQPTDQAPGPRDQVDPATTADAGTSAPVVEGDAAAGEATFFENGCGGCHTLAGLPGAVGEIGPNLNEALVDKNPDFIRTSIIDPGAFVEPGFDDGLMPVDYADTIPPQQLADLVAFLARATAAPAR